VVEPEPQTPHEHPEQAHVDPAVETQLGEAKAEIASLKKQIDSQLRQRNVPTTNTSRPTSANVLQTAAETGVPIKIVAYLCLAAFLLAYLFF
jgi:hypothetical protein